MSRIWIDAASAALLRALGFRALQAGAKRHSHRNKVVDRSARTTIGAEPNVQFVTAFCPTDTRRWAVAVTPLASR
jgi:hypothetical protein